MKLTLLPPEYGVTPVTDSRRSFPRLSDVTMSPGKIPTMDRASAAFSFEFAIPSLKLFRHGGTGLARPGMELLPKPQAIHDRKDFSRDLLLHCVSGIGNTPDNPRYEGYC
ncbi:hypothetical protein CO657_28715 (plasmid) [Rhizobium acidisoli]|uniref:Uncharacterized protein n=1 Tax=Rhizobium acidisoli TaxID=1538158 RepID=A0AAE5WSS2_9HYPH|nr:hypothetical protein [Rhizobium acidisoli]KPH04313.1 hypothetical protein AOG23_33835 [Rhizobium acidisoli]QAS81836.1 hypothetical protein CO657_28715 [Rhizobium acidisoli]